MYKYPEHERQSKVLGDAAVIGEFLEWLESKKIVLCQLDRFNDFGPIRKRTEELLADYFNIDLGCIESEKQLMLKEQRKLKR